MIRINLNKDNYQYDVLAIVKSFFTPEEVKIFSALESDECMDFSKITGREINIILTNYEMKIQVSLEPVKDLIKKRDASSCEDTSTYKNVFKLFLYDTLEEYTKKQLPWGNLTGIRPTKIAMGMLENGIKPDEIVEVLEEEYRVSSKKAELSVDIAKREKKLLSVLHYEEGYSLYIGIPFCPTTCLYCSFTSFPICVWEKRVAEYLEALAKEIVAVSELYADKMLETIYIGGGTPTTLTAKQFDLLLGKLEERFDLSHVLEFTVEAGRADSITIEKLQTLRKHGVTRISVNPQTMNQQTLDFIGRRHTVEQVVEAFHMGRETGFKNINMDIILGLPGEKDTEVKKTMDGILKLQPDSLTVHSLAIKRASRLNRFIEENGISMLHDTDGMMDIAAAGAQALHMKPYYLYRQKNMSGNLENVGFATEGNFGIYNILIMEEKQTIMALGAGSITKLVLPNGRIERADNIKDVAGYLERIDEMIERKRVLLENQGKTV